MSYGQTWDYDDRTYYEQATVIGMSHPLADVVGMPKTARGAEGRKGSVTTLRNGG